MKWNYKLDLDYKPQIYPILNTNLTLCSIQSIFQIVKLSNRALSLTLSLLHLPFKVLKDFQ